MIKTEAKERIEKLKKEVERHRYLYHVLDRQEISDAALDALKHELYTLEQQFPGLVTPDSPTQRVGGEPLPAFKKVSHRYPMLSMEDVFSADELSDWLARIKKIFPRGIYDFYAEIKMDGLAVSLIYKNGLFVKGSTRGDGRLGEDVTENLKTIDAIPLRLRVPSTKEIAVFLSRFGGGVDSDKLSASLAELNGEIEVRGEAFMSKKTFEQINKQQKKRGEAPFANPRNAAAGAIRQLDSKITANRRLDFYGYALLGDFGLTTHEQAHELMKLLGVKTNSLNRHCRDLVEVEKYHSAMADKRQKPDYWFDGIVLTVNDDRTFEKLGVVGKTPRAHVAYKFRAEQGTSVVEEVQWSVGRTGVLTPVATLRQVQLAGTTVTHATLHNIDEIERLGLRIGDTVIVEKAGDVIPKIIRVLPKLRPYGAKVIVSPAKCPICGSPVHRREGEVAIVCSNPRCYAVQRQRIAHFVSKAAFDISGLGEKIIDALLQAGLVRTPADLFTIKPGDVEPLERFAEKSSQKLVDSIRGAAQITLPRFLYALGIPHIGSETAVDLARHFGSLRKIQQASVEELNKIANVGDIMAESIAGFFQDEKNRELIAQLQKNGVEILRERRRGGKLAGKNFALTGTLKTLTRDEAKEKIYSLGGDVGSDVTKETDYVVVGEEPGSKLDRARKLGVALLDEKDFLKMLEI